MLFVVGIKIRLFRLSGKFRNELPYNIFDKGNIISRSYSVCNKKLL